MTKLLCISKETQYLKPRAGLSFRELFQLGLVVKLICQTVDEIHQAFHQCRVGCRRQLLDTSTHVCLSLYNVPWTSSSLNIHRDEHWLPVGHHITYKLCLTTWKTLHTSQPLYLSELISHYLPSRSLHSSNTYLLYQTTQYY